MSYPGVDPSDTIVTEPVGTQEVSEGNPLFEQKPPNPLADDYASVAKKAATQAVTDMFALTAEWEPKQLIKFVIEFGSGQKALVKHMTTMDLINAGLIEEVDFFTKKLFQTQEPATSDVERAEAGSQNFWNVLADPEKRQRFLEMTGRLMEMSSIKPKVIHDGVAVVEDEKGRKTTVFGSETGSIEKQIELFGGPIPTRAKGETYSSAIDIGDRLFWFQELQKPLELIKPFRGEQDALLGSVQPSEEPELPSV